MYVQKNMSTICKYVRICAKHVQVYIFIQYLYIYISTVYINAKTWTDASIDIPVLVYPQVAGSRHPWFMSNVGSTWINLFNKPFLWNKPTQTINLTLLIWPPVLASEWWKICRSRSVLSWRIIGKNVWNILGWSPIPRTVTFPEW